MVEDLQPSGRRQESLPQILLCRPLLAVLSRTHPPTCYLLPDNSVEVVGMPSFIELDFTGATPSCSDSPTISGLIISENRSPDKSQSFQDIAGCVAIRASYTSFSRRTDMLTKAFAGCESFENSVIDEIVFDIYCQRRGQGSTYVLEAQQK